MYFLHLHDGRRKIGDVDQVGLRPTRERHLHFDLVLFWMILDPDPEG